MGASAREIEREVERTRDGKDANVMRQEGSAATRALRYRRWLALGVGALAAAGVGFLVYRRARRPRLRDRLNDLSVKRLRELLEKFREELPSVTVTVNDKSAREPDIVESIARTVAPALIGTASTAVLERMVRPPERPRRAS
jgi:hypothetical protein